MHVGSSVLPFLTLSHWQKSRFSSYSQIRAILLLKMQSEHFLLLLLIESVQPLKSMGRKCHRQWDVCFHFIFLTTTTAIRSECIPSCHWYGDTPQWWLWTSCPALPQSRQAWWGSEEVEVWQLSLASLFIHTKQISKYTVDSYIAIDWKMFVECK